jgi:hypothetical protein
MELLSAVGLPVVLLSATTLSALFALGLWPWQPARNASSGPSLRLKRPDQGAGRTLAKKRLFLALVGAVGAFLALPLALVGLLLLQSALAPAVRWEMPAGFRGWVTVRYEDPTCPALRREAGMLVVPVNTLGCGCTSEPIPDRWRPSYVYVHPDGKIIEIRSTGWGGGGEVWGGFTSPRQASHQFPELGFYVGTENEFKQGAFGPPPRPTDPPRC